MLVVIRHDGDGVSLWIDGYEQRFHGLALRSEQVQRLGDHRQTGGANIRTVGVAEIDDFVGIGIVCFGNGGARVIGELKGPSDQRAARVTSLAGLGYHPNTGADRANKNDTEHGDQYDESSIGHGLARQVQ
jgi:hypothetical protein